MTRLLLLDKSALVRGVEVEPRWQDAELCLCMITRLEMLYSARSKADYAALETALDAFRELRMDVQTFAVAATAQRELAATGEHGVPLPDLLLGACAQQHAADVLHVDRHFDTLAKVLGFRALRADGLSRTGIYASAPRASGASTFSATRLATAAGVRPTSSRSSAGVPWVT